MLWLNSFGQIIQETGGSNLIDCTVCPCGGCLDCTNLPISIDVKFNDEPSSINPPSGWKDTWHLTYAGGCCYTLTTGLPCTCTKLEACIIASGSDGIYQVAVKSYYPDSKFSTITISLSGKSGTDCHVNGNGTPTSPVGYSADSPPCDFLMVFVDKTRVTITSNA